MKFLFYEIRYWVVLLLARMGLRQDYYAFRPFNVRRCVQRTH